MLSFQIVDLRDFDEEDEEEEDSESTTRQEKKYVVRVFGRTRCEDPKYPDKSVCLILDGFEPYFYLRVPAGFPHRELATWLEEGRCVRDVSVSPPFKSKDFDGFRADEPSWFVKIKCPTMQLMRRTARTINNAQNMEVEVWVEGKQSDSAIRSHCYETLFKGLTIRDLQIQEPFSAEENCTRLVRIRFPDEEEYHAAIAKILPRAKMSPDMKSFDARLRECKLYESNIEPILRFMHHSNVRGNSWVKAPASRFIQTDYRLEGRMNWELVTPDEPLNEAAVSARFRVLSYDIETMSTDPDGGFPQASRTGDVVMQIGMTFNYYHHSEAYKKVLISLKSCDAIEGVDVRSFETEEEVLLDFLKVMVEEDPDVLTGYNTFGFDNLYMKDRATMLGIGDEFSFWGRHGAPCRFREKKLSSSALGDNFLYYYDSPGRVQVDLFKVIQRDHNLPSYRLDYVSSHFNQNKITEVGDGWFDTKSTSGMEVGGFFTVKVIENDSCGVEDELPTKFRVQRIEGDRVYFEGGTIPTGKHVVTTLWAMAKDDISPKDMFRMWPQGSAERAIIGRYCVKDTLLVGFLMEKLSVLANNFQMANVCFIPIPYVFLRGQGIKGFSLVSEECMRAGYLIPVVRKEDFTNTMWKKKEEERLHAYGKKDSECTYEHCGTKGRLAMYVGGVVVCEACSRVQYDASFKGARVIDPRPGRYVDPVCVLDFASLYPRSILAKNISWETVVEDERYLNLEGYQYHEVQYETTTGKAVTCWFAQRTDGTPGMIPRILTKLLDARASTRKLLKQITCPFKRKVLDGAQLSFKLSSNSIYGINGSLTSPLYKKSIAACTTATGKAMLERAQTFVEEEFKTLVEDFEDGHWVKPFIPFLKPKVVYGDTDSTFVDFGYPPDMTVKEKVALAIKLGKLAEELLNPLLPVPEEIEYEKTFCPWIILTKKRYAGMKYEFDPENATFSFMGLQLKRRDSSLIVKKVLGGILHRMMTDASTENVIDYVKRILQDIVEGKHGMRMFILSKKLRSSYANPDSLAHVVLARRMAERDPGNAPASGDRLSYVAVYNKKLLDKKVLQSERIESADYVKEHNLPIDYVFYLERQVMVPACQFLTLLTKNPEKEIFQPIMDKVMKERRYLANKKQVDFFRNYFGVGSK